MSVFPSDVERFWQHQQARLPSPFTPQDRGRGYGYRLSIRQLELSDTRVDRPAHGRDWFELMLEDQLALGRPDHVQVVFARETRRTPAFRTRIIDDGVEPQIQAQYKHSLSGAAPSQPRGLERGGHARRGGSGRRRGRRRQPRGGEERGDQRDD